MNKITVAKNMSVEDFMSFDDLYDEISSNSDLKAERLINRREKELKRQDAW
jgi:hypothetical protein